MSLPTGSAIERAMRCAASCALSRAPHTGEDAIAGTANHDAIEAGDRSRPVVRRVLDGAEDVRKEVAYALDVATRSVREIGVSVGRNYGDLAPTEIALTVDVEQRVLGRWRVVDWKSRERATGARDNWQIRGAVLAIMGRHRVDEADGALAYLDDGEIDEAPFDAIDAAGYWSELARMVDRVRAAQDAVRAGKVVDVSSGPWCRYCPSLPHCPAHTRLALSLLGELEAVDATVAGLTVEQCGRAWELLRRYEQIADRVKTSIRERARTEFIPLGSGKRLALVESSRRSLDTKKAAEMLGDAAPYKVSTFTQVREVTNKENDGT